MPWKHYAYKPFFNPGGPFDDHRSFLSIQSTAGSPAIGNVSRVLVILYRVSHTARHVPATIRRRAIRR